MKKLIPAIAMLLVAVSLLGTSTFAWFSMNKTVSGTGMTVTAKSDAASVVIQVGSEFNSAGTDVSATASGSTTLLPVKHKSTTLTVADMKTAASWEYGYSDDTTSATMSGSASTVTTLSNYLGSNTFAVGLNKSAGSGVTVTNLTIASVTLPANTGICAVFVCGSNIFEYKSSVTSGGTNVILDKVTTTGSAITVYYYIDGDNTNVTSSAYEAKTLTGNVSFTLTATVG